MRWNTINIDWAKAEEEPERIFKVEGKYLLDIRAKTADLERNIINYRENAKKANEELGKLKDEFNATKSIFEELKESNRKLEADLNIRLEDAKALELKLKDAENKITEYQNYKNQTIAKEKEFESIINELKNEMESKIPEMEREIDSLKSELSDIKDIKEELEKSINQNEDTILDLKKRNQDLETQMLQAINVPKLLKEIKEVLEHKGFISEMEFENIMKKI